MVFYPRNLVLISISFGLQLYSKRGSPVGGQGEGGGGRYAVHNVMTLHMTLYY